MKYANNIAAIDELSASEGVFTTAQAQRLGISRNALSHACKVGRLERVAHGAYRLSGAPSSETDELAAIWKLTASTAFSWERQAKWDGVAVDGSTAAWLLGIGDFHLSPYRIYRTEEKGIPMTMVTATPPAGIATAGTSDNCNVLLSVRDVRKVYGSREAVTRALDDVSFDICKGEFVGVMGPSGSGKSTLLNCISTIDTVTSGNIILNGLDITQLRSRQLSKFRRDDLGFIFQDANLLDTLTGFENIALALTIKGEKADAVRAKVDSTANMLGVTDVLQKYPRQMSGGQRQRVAAARAIVADPKLVLADEPTGALDSRNAAVLLETLEVLNAKLHATIMMVTHDAVAASYADRILFIKDGKLFNELRRGDSSRTDFYQRILEVQAFLSGKQGDSPAVSFAPSHAVKPRN